MPNTNAAAQAVNNLNPPLLGCAPTPFGLMHRKLADRQIVLLKTTAIAFRVPRWPESFSDNHWNGQAQHHARHGPALVWNWGKQTAAKQEKRIACKAQKKVEDQSVIPPQKCCRWCARCWCLSLPAVAAAMLGVGRGPPGQHRLLVQGAGAGERPAAGLPAQVGH